MSKKFEKKILKVAEKVIGIKVKEEFSRPPICNGFLHQPKRPVKENTRSFRDVL